MQGSPGGHSCPGTVIAAGRAKQMFGPRVLTSRHYVSSAAAFAGSQSTGSFKAAQVALMGLLRPHLSTDPHSQPIALFSSSERLEHFRQCNTCLSHSPMPSTATFSPLKQGSSSLVVISPCKSKSNMLTNTLASLNNPPCAPCISSSASSPWTPCLSPASCAEANSRKLGFAATSHPGPRLPFIQHSQNPRFYH
ncbi:G protein pathway suppressor 2 [Galemys pyrenaicus]|uniref:G protein pathway suppressor 2 n=1 Tax=Galemys pyrenaicus TaxID=202257 RepID=A0A8J6DKZ3_GALPY|nr:G protein pathway suppressor 2 [Galemys pyrenaicus]